MTNYYTQEGSSLVPAMSVDNDRITEAIDAASVMIICVSYQYKLSANCRCEASYASQRAKRGKIRLLYVMMQEEYTTVSSPDSCDVSTIK